MTQWKEVPSPLANVLGNVWNVNARTGNWKRSAVALIHLRNEWPNLFAEQLREAITEQKISPEQYRRLTEDSNVVYAENVDWRLRELWEGIYGSPFGGDADESRSESAAAEDDE